MVRCTTWKIVFWWYAGMRKLTSVFFADLELNARRPRVLDAGCGTGANLAHFAYLGDLTGVDIESEALTFCRRRDMTALVQGSVTRLPFASEAFDLLYCFEVLYHAQAVDDVAALREFWRLLTPGGYCVIRLPAYQWLLSAHGRRGAHTAPLYRGRSAPKGSRRRV